MKPFALLLTVLALAAAACASVPATPTLDIHFVETIAAGTLTALAPTQSPPTLAPIPTLTNAPPATSFPTLTPPSGGPTRIQFPAGGVSATLTGIVTFPDRPQYVLYAFKGQRLTAQITSNNGAANFAITGVTDGQPYKRLVNESRTFEVILPATQDYLFSVAVPEGSASYALTVTIVWP